MLKRSDWILDTRPIVIGQKGNRAAVSWEDRLKRRPNLKETWLRSIIELLLKNQDWAGAYLLIRIHVTTCKKSEGTRTYNRTPFDESGHVRALKLWFWSKCEEYGFSLEEDTPYDEQTLDDRRILEKQAKKDYPFVGGRPRRQHSESVEFFQQVAADRELHTKFRPSGEKGKKTP